MTDIVIASRPASIKPSPSMAAMSLVTKLRGEGREIIDFTIGEPDFDTPRHITEAAMRAAMAGETRYTASNGTAELRAAIAGKFFRENALVVDEDSIAVGCGAKQLIFTAYAATLEEEDEVIVPAPYWVSYPDMAIVNGGTPVFVVCGEDVGFKLTPERLESAITARTKWLVLNSPNNPSGSVYTPDEMAALALVLERHPQVLVMTDEIYEHVVYDGVTTASFAKVVPELADRTLTINGVSKAYAMTGWRIGYATGPKILIRTITSLLSQSTSCPSSVSQAAAVAALTGDQSFVRRANASYEERRDRVMDLLKYVPEISFRRPEGAFYAYLNVSGLIGKQTTIGDVLGTDLDVTMFLLREAGVAVLDGASYGLSPYVRLAFATSLDTIEAGCAQIRNACAALH